MTKTSLINWKYKKSSWFLYVTDSTVLYTNWFWKQRLKNKGHSSFKMSFSFIQDEVLCVWPHKVNATHSAHLGVFPISPSHPTSSEQGVLWLILLNIIFVKWVKAKLHLRTSLQNVILRNTKAGRKIRLKQTSQIDWRTGTNAKTSGLYSELCYSRQ